MTNKTSFIYGLVDPITFAVRYVGKSNNPTKRFNDHLAEAKRNTDTSTYKRNWILSLLKVNLAPALIILEEVNASEWQQKEKFYISLHKELGAALTNLTDGGEGVLLRGKSNGMFGKKASPETKKKMSESHLKRWTPEAKEKQSDILKGKKHKAYDRKPHTQETIAKIKAANSGKKRSPEYLKWRMDNNIAQLSGAKNGMAKSITLKSPDGILYYSVGAFKKLCDEHDLSYATMNRILQKKIYPSSGRCLGWDCWFS